MRLLRRLLLLVLLLAAALAGFVGWRLSTVPPLALVADATARLAAAGIAVRIDGEPEPVLWPWPGLRVGAVHAAGAAVRLSAGEARLGVSMRDLLSGRVTLGRVRLDDAVLELEHPILPRPLALTAAALVVSTGPDGSLSLAGDGDFAGRRVSLAAEIADPAALAAGRPSAVTVALEAQGDRVRFAGDAALVPSLPLPALDGTVTAELADPQGLSLWLAGAAPGPVLATLKAVDFEADIDAAPDRLLLRGRGSAALGGRPVGVDATLRGAEDWMRTGVGSIALTVRSGGLFSSYWQGAFGPDTAGAWQASGPVTVAILDLDALRAWSAHDLPDLPAEGSARLLGELAVSPGSLVISDLELHRDGAEPLVGAIALDLETGAVRGGLGADPPASPPSPTSPVAKTDVVPGVSGPLAPAASAAGPGGDAAEPAWQPGRTADDPLDERPPVPLASIDRIGTSRTAPVPAPADAAEAPGEAAPAGIAGDPAEDQRGAPLPPGAPPPPPVRPDPPTAPVPRPRAALPALAPADTDP